jgi:hypothetical protein
MNLAELLSREEPLNEELEMYRIDGEFFPMIKHPLIFSVPYSPQNNAWLNAQLEMRTKEATNALKEGNWSRYIFMHEKPHRLDAFRDIESLMENKEYWELLHDVWTNTENAWQNKDEWYEMFNSDRASRMYFMPKEDRDVYKTLPMELTIYRGYHKSNDNANGFSWTLDRAIAERFAKHYKGEGEVISKVVKRTEIFAYTDTRSEQEIIYIGDYEQQ